VFFLLCRDSPGIRAIMKQPVDKAATYVFGPVPSRRLGRSLGVDLIPFKTCTYDCVYCQLGRTTCKTTERRDWVPIDDVMEQVRAALPTLPDYITLSGSGEPTLNARIGDVIDRIKQMTKIPVAVLTNGALLWDQEVRRELAGADLILPSLDAGDDAMFQTVNRPHRDIPFAKMVDGLAACKAEFHGRYWLEVFLLDGYTACEEEAGKIARRAAEIKPDLVQLNTVSRPPAESFATGASFDCLERLAKLFTPAAEVIADISEEAETKDGHWSMQDILHLLQRRPCTVSDIAYGLGVHRNEVVKHLGRLERRGLVSEEKICGSTYFRATLMKSTRGKEETTKAPEEDAL